jgi:hypothetical protein
MVSSKQTEQLRTLNHEFGASRFESQQRASQKTTVSPSPDVVGKNCTRLRCTSLRQRLEPQPRLPHCTSTNDTSFSRAGSGKVHLLRGLRSVAAVIIQNC